MKKYMKHFGLLAVIALLTISCDKHPSLQKYYVDSNENTDFISLDIPASILSLKDENVSVEVKETLKSIKKVNFLGFQLKDGNEAEYKIEKQKVKEILNNPKYQELISVGGKQSFTIKFLGEDNAIDEVIVFGSDRSKGFALIRILGKDMDPSKMMLLANEIKYDGDEGDLKGLESFFKNLN
ncbi:MAG: DUF4252 domain-containing protein [Flavobacteriaceae bacterium]|nr:DUF4252 domain-containing protein [Flavobacteriaceae bacterium]